MFTWEVPGCTMGCLFPVTEMIFCGYLASSGRITYHSRKKWQKIRIGSWLGLWIAQISVTSSVWGFNVRQWGRAVAKKGPIWHYGCWVCMLTEIKAFIYLILAVKQLVCIQNLFYLLYLNPHHPPQNRSGRWKQGVVSQTHRRPPAAS